MMCSRLKPSCAKIDGSRPARKMSALPSSPREGQGLAVTPFTPFSHNRPNPPLKVLNTQWPESPL